MVEFTFKGIIFVVRRNGSSGIIEYKDKAHLGGPWSQAANSIYETSLHPAFRRKLKEAYEQISPRTF